MPRSSPNKHVPIQALKEAVINVSALMSAEGTAEVQKEAPVEFKFGQIKICNSDKENVIA